MANCAHFNMGSCQFGMQKSANLVVDEKPLLGLSQHDLYIYEKCLKLAQNGDAFCSAK